MHLQSKLNSEMCQKVVCLDEKKKEKNRLKVLNLPLFLQKTITFIEKKITNRFSIEKIRVPTNF